MARCIRSNTMNGCLKGVCRLGCALVVVGVLALAWWFRGPIMAQVAHWFGRSTALPPVADTAVGAPTPAATASGEAKAGNIRTTGGPDSVVLTPNEMASLIGAGIDWNVRKMYDSLRVELQEGTLILHARLDKRARPRRPAAGAPGALRGNVRRARAAAHGRHRVHRTAGHGAIRHHPDHAARDRNPRPARQTAHEADGRRVVQRGRAGQSGPGGDRREGPYHGRRALQAPAIAMTKRRVLIVDDEKGIREALKQVLEYEEIEVQVCASGQEAMRVYPEFQPHLVFLDVKMEGMDGLETLKRIRALDGQAQVVMISGHGTIQTAVEATQLGAYDFLEKPLDTDRILLTLRNALQHVVLVHENVRLKQEVRTHYEIVGTSKPIRSLIALIEKVGPTPARVLITGENGTGKELVARAIHALSPRAAGPFVEVNCAAIPGELIESELFGHMKGSFTGAVADRPGKFELADGGTLFLDEVGDMSLSAQAKVLRALQEGVISRVGSAKSVPVDVRVIAATNKDVEREIAMGRFREDLLHRLNVIPIHVPPLRERRSDVAQLVQHFSQQLTKDSGL